MEDMRDVMGDGRRYTNIQRKEETGIGEAWAHKLIIMMRRGAVALNKYGILPVELYVEDSFKWKVTV